DGYPHVFYEDREDLRITVSPDGVVRVVETRHSGLAVRTGAPRRRPRSISSPRLEDVSALVADRPLAGVSLPIPIAPRLDTDEALRALTRLVELVRTACGDA